MNENQHQKIVNVSYLAFAALVAFILLTGMMKIADTYDFEARIKSIEYVIRGISIALAVGIFAGLYRSPTVNSFMNEVVTELFNKVTWPARRDTMVATGVVMVTVLIAGVVLAVFDWLWTIALRWVL